MSHNGIYRDDHIMKKKKRRRRIFFFLIIPLLIVTFSAAAFGAVVLKKAETVFNKSYDNIDGREKSNLRETAVNPDVDNVSILFIGVDGSDVRGNTKDRSDALMLATLNEKDKSVKLVSIPRDSYVYLEDAGYKTKINHAHAYGGPKASIEAVEQLMNIPVDYYVKMNFNAFIDVVDALEGINVDVPYELKEQNSKDKANAIHLMPGEQTLDGEEALALARTRHYDNDIERGKRQQMILQGIVKKAASGNAITKYDDILEAIGNNMATNMTFSEMKAFSSYGLTKKLSIENITLEGEDTYIDGVYYWLLDETSVANTSLELRNHLGLSQSQTADNINTEENGEETDPYGTEDDTTTTEEESDPYSESTDESGTYDDTSDDTGTYDETGEDTGPALEEIPHAETESDPYAEQ
ncbi:LytR family transcriptional regulator [Rossellomorea marisflavi]|nr:LytR family transcriptional regulator [Rossellomorea marisflavi]